VKYRFSTDLGPTPLTNEQAQILAGTDPDLHREDLYQAIDNATKGVGSFPSWTLYVKIIPEEAVPSIPFDIFDPTKFIDWPETKVGTMVLNKYPTNFFAETDQVAFDPVNLVPGIEFS
jgi:catalase